MDNPFSWDYLTTTPGSNEVFGAFAIGFLVIFLTGFLVSFVAYAGWADRFVKDALWRRMIRRWSGWALTLFSIGLFFFLVRILQINPFTFGQRVWLYLCLLSLVGFVAWCAYDYHRSAPEIRKQIEDRKRMQQVAVTVKGTRGVSATVPVGGRPVKRKRR